MCVRKYHADVTHACVYTRKVPVQLSTEMHNFESTRDELQNARKHASHTCAQSLNRAVPYNNLSHTDTRFKTGRQHMIFLVHKVHTYTIT